MDDRWTASDRGSQRRSIRELAVGIVGLGSIGTAVAARLEPFGCSIAWYGPRPKPDAPWPRTSSLAALARDCDVMILALPLTPATEGLIDREVLDLLGHRGFLVNVARGGLVDEDALIAALREGTLGAAALDVQRSEPPSRGYWRSVPNILLTPHIGGVATGALANLDALLRANLRSFFSGAGPLNPVN